MAPTLKVWLLLAAAVAQEGESWQGERPSELVALYSVPAVVKSALPHSYVAVGGIREWDWCNVGGRSFCTRALNQRKKVEWAEEKGQARAGGPRGALREAARGRASRSAAAVVVGG